MLRDAQPNPHAIRGRLPRRSGRRSRRAVGGVGSTRDAVLRASDGVSVASVSVFGNSNSSIIIPRAPVVVCVCKININFFFKWW